jgi:hypothetical protein
MTPTQLMTLAGAADRSTPCEACGPLRSPGWESMPGSFEQTRLELVGTLRAAGD